MCYVRDLIIKDFNNNIEDGARPDVTASCKSNQINLTNYFIVRLKVDQRAGQLSLPHLGITKTEKNRTKT